MPSCVLSVGVALGVVCVVGAVLALGCGVAGLWWCSVRMPCLLAVVVVRVWVAHVVSVVPALGVGCWVGAGARCGCCGCPQLLQQHAALPCCAVLCAALPYAVPLAGLRAGALRCSVLVSLLLCGPPGVALLRRAALPCCTVLSAELFRYRPPPLVHPPPPPPAGEVLQGKPGANVPQTPSAWQRRRRQRPRRTPRRRRGSGSRP